MEFTLPAITEDNVLQVQYVNGILEKLKWKARSDHFRGIEHQVWSNWLRISDFFN